MSSRIHKTGQLESDDPGKNVRAFLKKYYEKRKRKSGVTYAQLAQETGLAPSTLTTILGDAKRRPSQPSVRVVVKLARALCPDTREVTEFTQEALELARWSSSRAAAGVLDRVETTHQVRCALVQAEPFAWRDGNRELGFAVDIFRHLCNLMDIRPAWREDLTFNQLPDALRTGTVDIVVCGVVPTFRRRRHMSFSRPFPYISLPVSAVCKEGSDIKIEDLLRGQVHERLLLVKGEVGHDFARTLLQDRLHDGVDYAESLDAGDLIQRLSADAGPRVLLADMTACAKVLSEAEELGEKSSLKAVGLRDREDDVNRAVSHEREYPHRLVELGDYRVAFALPHGEDDWKKRIDEALDSLLSEGLRVLLGVYLKWLKRERGLWDFFRVEPGYGVGSRRVFDAFTALQGNLRRPQENRAR